MSNCLCIPVPPPFPAALARQAPVAPVLAVRHACFPPPQGTGRFGRADLLYVCLVRDA
ncbi:uncharacterized protein K452DRAFT_290196 [Aplosporella prunicola CBS 121167]|uniref:Uncharacterized protein n=1 Tax=Aplosporella prunicola CBS 121167 TaxID=1176127 RepID=A0A6A6B4Y6_9PEZI|nr:uncharacterized protein K452DRAFT_290196 [Aplosporella prunicola CBS 121167]KAF2139100.1 hypothetical protein K452DRAFT_290196 [Aplosporella prunicola CBS 121167]